MNRLIRGPAAVTADAAVLVVAKPDWSTLGSELAAPHAWLAQTGADAAAAELASAALWCLAAWLGFGLVCMAGAAVPGRAGALFNAAAHVALPTMLRRLVIGSAGVGVLLAPVAAGAASSSPADPTAPPPTTVSAPGWPTDVQPSTAQPSTAPSSHTQPSTAPPSPTQPSTAPPSTAPPSTAQPSTAQPSTTQPSTTQPSTAPRSPAGNAGPGPVPTNAPPVGTRPASVPAPGWPTDTRSPPVRSVPRPPRHAAEPGPPAHRETGADVVVRPGDSLWLIAANRMAGAPPERSVATEWPRWYAANRSTIGSDPRLIHPGQVLAPPTPEGPIR